MNKLFLSVFPVILLAFTVSGCNSTSGNEGSNLTGDEKSSAKIEFLTKETFKQKVWDYEKNQQTLSLIQISEPTRLLSISYAVSRLKKKNIRLPLTLIILLASANITHRH